MTLKVVTIDEGDEPIDTLVVNGDRAAAELEEEINQLLLDSGQDQLDLTVRIRTVSPDLDSFKGWLQYVSGEED